MAGRPRKPTKIHELSGAYKINPNRRPVGEPKPDGKFSSEPSIWLSEMEVFCWRELQQKIPPQVLTNADDFLVEQTAVLLAISRSHGLLPMSSTDRGLLIRCLSQLGCTPADRSKIHIPEAPKKENSFAKVGYR